MKKHFKILFLSLMILTLFAFISSCGTEIAIPDSDNGANNVEGEGAGEKGENANDDNSIEEDSGIPNCKHEYSEKVIIASTCLKEGIGKKTCSLCGKIQSVVIPKVAHVEVIDEAIAPTCTTVGKTEGKHCSVCNTILEAQKTVAALGHTEVIDEAIHATCTTPGWTEGIHCSVCNTVLVAQEAVTTSHNIVKRTHTPVSCKSNGSIELYCTSCNTVTKYETILKGHYSSTHEYASITHPEIGDLCVGFDHGDKCELCNARFIAPGTYTVVSFGSWQGTVQFKFDYYNNLGVKQSASKITQSQDALGYYTLKFDDYVAYGYDEEAYEYKKNYSGIITITEEAFAVVDQSFYGIFTQYFEVGEYTLSGKYEFREGAFATGSGLLNAPAGTHNVSFKYLGTDGTEYHSDYIQILTTSDGPQMNYSGRGNVAYFSYSGEWGAYDSNFKPYVLFEAPQTVSKEFFEWFTSVAAKVVA